MPTKKESLPAMETEDVELILEPEDDSLIFEPMLISNDEEEVEEDGDLVMPAQAVVPTSLSDIEAAITDIDDAVEFLTWVIYGKNGTGKTTLLSTAQGVLILAAEDGTLSIKDKAKGQAKKLKIDTWEKLEAVYWLLKKGKATKDGIIINTATGQFTVKYVAIDTVTKLTEVCMRNVVLGDKASNKNTDIIKKTLKDWGDMGEKMKYWLQQFEELPVQRVWVCQENSNSDDVDSDEFSIYPSLNKSLRTYVLSEADIIARTYIANGEKGIQYRLSAAPNPKYVTKDRTSKINKGAIGNPSLEKIYNLVFDIK